MKEIWDIRDSWGNLSGKTAERGSKLQEGEYHLVVHLIIYSSSGKILMQKRHDEKNSWPSLWDISVGGSVISGEDSLQGILREAREEIGITLKKEELTLLFRSMDRNCIDDIFYAVREEQESFILQEDEVEEVKWMTRQEVEDLIKQRQVVPHFFLLQMFDFPKLGKIHEDFFV